MKAARPAPIEVLNFGKIKNTKETSRPTIKSVLNRNNLRKIEEKLRGAFVEFHRKLWSLKSYSFLNVLAISKILKKYDKVILVMILIFCMSFVPMTERCSTKLLLQITLRDATKSYMSIVDNSYLGSSDEVMKLIDHVEATFIKHFANGNRTKGTSCDQKPKERDIVLHFPQGSWVDACFLS